MPARTRAAAALALLATTAGTPARAAVSVLVNQADDPVTVTVTGDDGSRRRETLAPGDVAPFFSASPLVATFATAMGQRREPLAADAIHRFANVAAGGRRGIQLRRVLLAGERPAPPQPANWVVGAGRGDTPIRVLLCVDEEEPMRDALWKRRLVERLRKASEIIERHSGVRFEAAAYATWRSDDRMTQFEATLAEFEKSVSPPGETLAIGFSSQYRVERGRRRLGGTRGPLRKHILLREWSPRVSEPERVELLVHELGHFLGAAHSPEPASVMRPILGDRPVRLRSETVRFDAVNALAIAMVGEEVRRRGVRTLGEVSPTRRARLQTIYGTLAALTPGEPAAMALLGRLRGAGGVIAGEVVTQEDRLVAEAAEVVQAVTKAAAANRKRAVAERLTGDALASALLRAGAKAATNPKPMLIGLGIALDDVGGLYINPRTKDLAKSIESDRQRRQRLNVLGPATARGRHDTLKHFIVSAALTAIVGEKEANLWGIGKELADATRAGGSGFSFADLAANRAGVRFARGVLTGSPPVAGLSRRFDINNFVPSMDGLEEGLPLADVLKKYGGQGDPRFDAEIAEIDKRIEALPAYSLMSLGL